MKPETAVDFVRVLGREQPAAEALQIGMR